MSREECRNSLRPRISEVSAELASVDPVDLAARSGAQPADGGLELTFLSRLYHVDWPSFGVRPVGGESCSEELRILLLDYLRMSDGGRPAGRWIGYQELPDGAFYRSAFQGYTGDQLVRDLGGDIDAFRRAAQSLVGEPVPDIGDAAYAFRVLPHIPLAVVWWAGDGEFPANATVLFDETAGRYLPADGLAALGRMLCRQLAKVETS